MFAALDIGTSALVAQRTRMMAIRKTWPTSPVTRNERGESAPPATRFPVFQTDEQVGAYGAAG